MHALASELFPLFRSQTGDGVRKTFSILSDIIPLNVTEVPSGTKVFDWQVPDEWTMRAAYVADRSGRKVIDAADSSLHLVNGSMSIRADMTFRDLRPKLHTLPEQPELVPYRTAYFRRDWGFCLSHNEYRRLEAAGDDARYEVVIDTDLKPGSLTYGEHLVEGGTAGEVLFFCHSCHPSLANDNLSGMVVATALAGRLGQRRDLRHSYRFVFAPATIGSITWLALNQQNLSSIRHGLVLSLLGDPGPFTYKKSRQEIASIDQVMKQVLRARGVEHEIRPFTPTGYDERQFCSPGIDLPLGCLMRTPPGEFPEYHTSADNLDFVTPESLSGSLELLTEIVDVLEADQTFENLKPFGEPFLGKYGLYQSLPSSASAAEFQLAVQWVLNLSDRTNSLLDIAGRSELPFNVLKLAADRLLDAGLVRAISD